MSERIGENLMGKGSKPRPILAFLFAAQLVLWLWNIAERIEAAETPSTRSLIAAFVAFSGIVYSARPDWLSRCPFLAVPLFVVVGALLAWLRFV
jgi:hypothetical protein